VVRQNFNDFTLTLIRRECVPCNLRLELNGSSINGELFGQYLEFFLRDNPSEECAKAGHAAYSLGVKYEKNKYSGRSTPTATYFMSYHKILKTSRDYTEAMEEARVIGENITKTLNTGNYYYWSKSSIVPL